MPAATLAQPRGESPARRDAPRTPLRITRERIVRWLPAPGAKGAAERLLPRAARVLAEAATVHEAARALSALAAGTLGELCIVCVETGAGRVVESAAGDPGARELLAGVAAAGGPALSELLRPARAWCRSGLDVERIRRCVRDPDELARALALAPTAVMAVPLVTRGARVGCMLVGTRTPGRTLGGDHLAEALELAAVAAPALASAAASDGLRRAVAARDEVLRMVAHDLRNPLAAITMYTDLLIERTSGEQERGFLHAIDGCAGEMDHLVHDLLDCSTLDAGKLRLAPASLAVRPLLAEVAARFTGRAEAAGQELRVEVEPGTPAAWADHGRILQVLGNLVANASKFTPSGGRIRVRAAARHGEAVFSVTDTGVGMTPDQLAHVFDRFWQANPGGQPGAGLGLAIAQGIVEAHGGRIWAESTPGAGSTFAFTLPFASPVTRAPS